MVWVCSINIGSIIFSGIFKDAPGPLKVLDFNNVLGSFGTLGTINDGVGTLAANFRGDGGTGPRDGWLYALTLIPSVMFALGVVRVIDHLDGMKAAQKLLSPLLKPLLGLPGFAGLTLIASLQSTDAIASMTKELKDDGYIDEKQKLYFVHFNFQVRLQLRISLLLEQTISIYRRCTNIYTTCFNINYEVCWGELT